MKKKLFTENQLRKNPMSKGEAIEALYSGITCDAAIPQALCNYLSKKARWDISGDIVFGYPENNCFGLMLPLTIAGARILLAESEDKLSTLMTWDSLGIDTSDIIRIDFPVAGIQSRIEPVPEDPTAIDGAILEESVMSAGNMQNDDKYMDSLNT